MPKDIKKLLLKADELKNGKELALAKEFIDITENVDTVIGKIDSISDEIKLRDQLKEIQDKEENKKEVEISKINGVEMITLKGEKGDTPQKGKDYFTDEEVKSFLNKITPVKGKDYFDGKQGPQGPEGKQGPQGPQGPQGDPGINGRNGKDGRDGSPDTAEQIVEKLESLTEESRLDASAIKNLPEFIQGDKRIGFGSMIKEAPKDNKYYARKNREWVEVVTGGGTWGSITGTLSNQTDLQNALNAKQNSLGFTPENVANKSTSVSTDGTSDTKYPSVKAIKDYADSLVAGLLDYRGGYDASVNTFPTSGGSGTAGAISKGDMFIISIAGTLGGTAVQVGDSLIASVDTPAQTASNWNILNANITYVPEDVANKDTDVTLSLNSDTKYPTQKAVKTYVDLRELSSNKSTATTLGASDILYPTQKAVKTYIDNSVSTETENAQSGTSYTFALTDGGKMVTGSNSSPTTFTVPTNSSIGFPIGTRIDVLQIGTGKITIANSVGVTLLSQGGNKTIKEQYVACTLWKKDTDLWYLMGNLQA